MADLVGTMVADRFLVLKALGEGGMGRVYLAEHVRMGRKCALKVMSPRMAHDPDAISRFNREAANACKINHPNVAAVYDFGETSEGLIYLSMELVDGMPLTQLVEQNRQGLTPARAASITRQVADALGAAHELGIVHRDLKPDNIMIAKGKDGADVVKVVDFGIAKAADNDAQKVTKTGHVIGTPEYMSPEQLSGDKVDGRSDIYSLGLVAFNMLTGALPFPADSQQEAMIMRLTDRPRRLDEVAPGRGWTTELQQVLDRALERDAKNRYQNAPEMGRDFALAVDWMPESDMANAGTQLMGTPAAVSSSSEAATMPMSAPRAAQPPGATTPLPVTVSTRASAGVPPLVPERRRGVPLWAMGGAVVLVIGGGYAAVKLSQGEGAGVTPARAAQSDSVPYKSALDSPVTTPPSRPSLAQIPTVQALDSLRVLTTPSDDSIADVSRGQAAIPLIEGVLPNLASSKDSASALLFLGRAQLMTKDLSSACSTLNRIPGKALSVRDREHLAALRGPCARKS